MKTRKRFDINLEGSSGKPTDGTGTFSSDLQNLFAATEIATLFLDRELRILRFTPRVAELFNVRVVDRGRPISDLTHRLGYEHLHDDAEAVLSKLMPIEHEVQDDSGTWYLTRLLPYRSAENRIEGVAITFIDITTQKNAENALRSSVHELFIKGTWLRTILDSLSDGVIATGSEGRVNYFNSAAEHLTGWTQSEASGKSIRELYDLRTMAGKPVEQDPLLKALATGAPVAKERFMLNSRGGQTIAIEDAAAPIVVNNRVEGAVAIMADIRERLRQERQQEVERERLEEEVHKTTDELGQTRSELRALAGHLMTAQEEERRRLALELHDDLSQRVALMSLRADDAIARIHKDPEESAVLLEGIHAELLAVSRGLRELSHRLHPSIIEQLGLIASLRSACMSYRESGIDVTCLLPDQIPEVSLEIATALYRIAQEAIRNAQKHAKGAPIHVSMTTQENSLRLSVRDSGPGFEMNSACLAGGLGLLSMQERARSISGTLLIKPRLGEGTGLRHDSS